MLLDTKSEQILYDYFIRLIINLSVFVCGKQI